LTWISGSEGRPEGAVARAVRLRAGALGLAAALALAACGPSSPASGPPGGAGAAQPAAQAASVGGLPPLTASDRRHTVRLLAGGIGWDHAMAYVADADGYWKRYGLHVDFKYGNYGAEVQAVQAGQFDAAYLNIDQAMEFIARGERMRVVANTSYGGVELIARRGAGIRSLQDVRGRRMGINNRYNGLQVYFMENVLPAHGLKPDDVRYVVAPIPDIPQAFQQRQIDLYFLWEPAADQIVGTGQAKVVLGWKDTYDHGQIFRNALVLNQRFIDRHPALAKRLVWAHLDALNRIRTDPSNATSVLAKFGRWNADYTKLARESWNKIGWNREQVPDSWLRLTSSDLVALRLIPHPLQPAQVADYSFFKGYVYRR
jgi:ABC-type nitrate/sulfonate/bicarbonate transport system substrate-binding protein